MPKVSVIVPVYKVEAYIHRCVDSILAQTFADLELILVDDGSPDNCSAICDEYAAKDSRIHVIHQKNGGLSAARNAGIDWVFENSDSQWLTFVDSDDWIHPQMLELLFGAVQENCVKIAVCSYEETKGMNPEVMPEKLITQLWDTDKFFLNHFINGIIACGKLYHRECFEELRYPVGKIHEDEYTTYRILFSYSQVAVISAPLYAYYINPAGITKGIKTIKRADVIQAYEEQISFFQKGGYYDILKLRMPTYLGGCYALLKWIESSKEKAQYAVQRREIKQKLYDWSEMAWENDLIDLWQNYDVMWRFHPLKVITYRAKLIIGKRIRRLKDVFN